MGFIRYCFRLKCQTVCKPGSVPPRMRGRGWPFIWDVRCRTPRATDPSGGAEGPPGGAANRQATPPAAPTWSCSRWGLPCRRRCRRRGALLPHHFTLAAHAVPCRPRASHGRQGSAVCFCGTFPGVAPAGRYPAPCLRGARTFLPPADRKAGRRAAIRPSGMGRYGMRSDLLQTDPANREHAGPDPYAEGTGKLPHSFCTMRWNGRIEPGPDSNPTPDRDSNAVCCRFAADAAENRSRDRPPSSARHPDARMARPRSMRR